MPGGRKIVVEFLGKDVSASKTATAVESRFGKLGGNLDRVGQAAGKVLAGGLLLAGGAAAKFGKDLARIETLNAQTEAVIRSTGSAAGVTAKHIEDLTGALEKKTATEAEAIQEGANLLLTFKNIRNEAGAGNDIFDQSTVALTDMARAMGTEPKAAAIQLGKALNDPVKGIAALSRVGITFTKDQEQVIKKLVESGDVMGAQKIILKELTSQFGGSGEAFAATAEGKMALLGHRFGEIGERLTTTLMPAFDKFLKVGMKVLDWVDRNTKLAGILVGVFGGLAAALWLVSAALRVYTTVTAAHAAITKIMTASQWSLNASFLANPVFLIVAGIVALGAALVLAYQKSETFRAIVDGAFRAVKIAAEFVFNWVRDNWPLLLAIITGPIGLATLAVVKNWDKIKSAAGTAWDWVTSKINAFVVFFKGIPGRISSGARGMFDGIKNAFKSALNWVIDKWNGLSFRIPGVNTHIPGVGTIGGFTLSTPNISRLATGGIVKARPGGIIANIAEGGHDEIVAPLDGPHAPDWIKNGGGRGDDRPIVVKLYLDSKEIHQSLLKRKRDLGMPLELA